MFTFRELFLAAAIVVLLTSFVIDQQVLQALRDLTFGSW